MKLNKKEQEAADFLKEFADNLANGKATEYKQPVIDQLKKMGITIDFISHKEVKSLIRGKSDHFPWVITNAPWYIRGKESKTYLNFQIKARKPKSTKENEHA